MRRIKGDTALSQVLDATGDTAQPTEWGIWKGTQPPARKCCVPGCREEVLCPRLQDRLFRLFLQNCPESPQRGHSPSKGIKGDTALSQVLDATGDTAQPTEWGIWKGTQPPARKCCVPGCREEVLCPRLLMSPVADGEL